MKVEPPDYFEETDLTTCERVVKVDGNLVPEIAKMWLRDGVNLVHTDPSGVQIMAQVSGGEIAGYSACDGERNPLTIAIEHERMPKAQSSQNACNVMLIDAHGKVLKTYLMPNPKHLP